MSDIAIRVESLSKAYRIGLKEQRHETMLGALTSWVKSPLSNFRDLRKLSRFDDANVEDKRSKLEVSPSTDSPFSAPNNQLPTPNSTSAPADVIWALRDISFEVKLGEAIGIIGRNGAGKSTLLRILSRITEPTRGRAHVFGRVGSLLEVGTGFHPDLTGRENIYLNGTILGMKKREIDRKFDEIVDFSGVEKFIDTPVKRYSSGMRIRLGFSVAAHLEPEILVIDEVLAVGDAEFQRKCLGKMQDVASVGRTVLFVSHNMVAVQSLCSRGLLLDQGRIVKDAPAAEVISSYLQASNPARETVEWSDPSVAPGNEVLRIKRVAVTPRDCGEVTAAIEMDTPIQLAVDYWVLVGGRNLHLTFHLLNDQGIVVLTSGFRSANHDSGEYAASCGIPGNLLNSGGYSFKLLVVENGNNVIHTIDNIVHFEVVDVGHRAGSWMGREPGVVQPPLQWETRRLEGMAVTAR